MLAVQVPIIEDVLSALGICRLGADGFEADDAIGTLVQRHRGRMPIDIATGHLGDLFQLVDDAAAVRRQHRPRRVRSPDLVDQAYLADRYGVASGRAVCRHGRPAWRHQRRPPWVVGIGEKTAARLITAYGTLAAVRAAVDGGDPALKGAQRRNLEAASAYLDVGPLVVRVALDPRARRRSGPADAHRGPAPHVPAGTRPRRTHQPPGRRSGDRLT